MQTANIFSGFRKCEISPLNRGEVWKRLPPSRCNEWHCHRLFESIANLYFDLRFGWSKRSPETSYTREVIDNESTGEQEEISDTETDQGDKPPQRVHLYGRIFENTFAIDTDDINTDVRSTVSFKVNRWKDEKYKFYIGNVTKCDNRTDQFEVTFLRKNGTCTIYPMYQILHNLRKW